MQTGLWLPVRYNLMYQHVSDWHNNQGIIRQAEEQGMGIILMRPLTSGVFQRLMAEAFPSTDAASEGGWSRPAATQLCPVGPLRGSGAGRDARAAICGKVPGTGTPRSRMTSRRASTGTKRASVALHDRYVR